ncbi:MAG: hypothetical protein NZO58_11520 [Gemmataceae bacterium]|nr:hypothetical protein [Gemmataceae bacterium]
MIVKRWDMLRGWTLVLALAWLVWGSVPAVACPLCKEAIANADADDQNANLPRAYNQSIYLMLTVPYVCLGVVGVMIYRGCKKNEAYRAALAQAAGAPSAPRGGTSETGAGT